MYYALLRLSLEGCSSFPETPYYYMNELSPIMCSQNEAPVFEHVLECIFEFQSVLKTHSKTCSETGPSF